MAPPLNSPLNVALNRPLNGPPLNVPLNVYTERHVHVPYNFERVLYLLNDQKSVKPLMEAMEVKISDQHCRHYASAHIDKLFGNMSVMIDGGHVMT
eukprot:242477-Amorphochlora_amoeboformis.AAC.1